MESTETLPFFKNLPNAAKVVAGYQPGVLVINWMRQGVGFGELVLKARPDGKLFMDTECMSRKFVMGVLKQLVDEGVCDFETAQNRDQ